MNRPLTSFPTLDPIRNSGALHWPQLRQCKTGRRQRPADMGRRQRWRQAFVLSSRFVTLSDESTSDLFFYSLSNLKFRRSALATSARGQGLPIQGMTPQKTSNIQRHTIPAADSPFICYAFFCPIFLSASLVWTTSDLRFDFYVLCLFSCYVFGFNVLGFLDHN